MRREANRRATLASNWVVCRRNSKQNSILYCTVPFWSRSARTAFLCRLFVEEEWELEMEFVSNLKRVKAIKEIGISNQVAGRLIFEPKFLTDQSGRKVEFTEFPKILLTGTCYWVWKLWKERTKQISEQLKWRDEEKTFQASFRISFIFSHKHINFRSGPHAKHWFPP